MMLAGEAANGDITLTGTLKQSTAFPEKPVSHGSFTGTQFTVHSRVPNSARRSVPDNEARLY